MWPRTTVMMPPSPSRLFASFLAAVTRRALFGENFNGPLLLQNLPRTLPSLMSSITALSLIVGASLLDEPPQDLEVTIPGCSTGHFFIPRTALAPRVAQDL